MGRIDDLYKVTNDIYEKVGKMESDVAEIKYEVKKTNGRVTALEKMKWKLVGIVSVVVFVVTVFREEILKAITK